MSWRGGKVIRDSILQPLSLVIDLTWPSPSPPADFNLSYSIDLRGNTYHKIPLFSVDSLNKPSHACRVQEHFFYITLSYLLQHCYILLFRDLRVVFICVILSRKIVFCDVLYSSNFIAVFSKQKKRSNIWMTVLEICVGIAAFTTHMTLTAKNTTLKN